MRKRNKWEVAFHEQALPKIEDFFGLERLIDCADEDLDRHRACGIPGHHEALCAMQALDKWSAIDYLHKLGGSVIGVGARGQGGHWDTITIRHVTDRGNHHTEMAKIGRAYTEPNFPLRPSINAQGYFNPVTQELTHINVATTGVIWRCFEAGIYDRRHGGAWFLAFMMDDLAAHAGPKDIVATWHQGSWSRREKRASVA